MVDGRTASFSNSAEDQAAIIALIKQRVRQAERSSRGTLRVSAAGKAQIADFARTFLSQIDERGLPPGIDADTLSRQVVQLVPVFLRSVRAEARSRGMIKRSATRVTSLPADLIARELPEFMANRCHCWPR